jgi:hypothetical protein
MQGGNPVLRLAHRLVAFSMLALGLAGLGGCPQPAKAPPGGTAPAAAPATGTPGGSSRASNPHPDPAAARALEIWADPVLVGALTGLARDYAQAVGGSYTVTPVERGALLDWARSGDTAGQPAPDLLAFPGQSTYAALLGAKRIDEASARTFAGDRLVVLKPLGSGFTSPTVFDLWELRFHHLAVADPQRTALGLFTQNALVSDGAAKRLAARTQTYPDSTALPELPAKDDSTLAFAFMSQAGGSIGVEPLLLVDKSLHEAIQYRAVAAAGKGTDAAVQACLRWLAEDQQTQTALGGYGLLNRAAALDLAAPIAATTPPGSAPAPPAAGGKAGR